MARTAPRDENLKRGFSRLDGRCPVGQAPALAPVKPVSKPAAVRADPSAGLRLRNSSNWQRQPKHGRRNTVNLPIVIVILVPKTGQRKSQSRPRLRSPKKRLYVTPLCASHTQYQNQPLRPVISRPSRRRPQPDPAVEPVELREDIRLLTRGDSSSIPSVVGPSAAQSVIRDSRLASSIRGSGDSGRLRRYRPSRWARGTGCRSLGSLSVPVHHQALILGYA